MTTVQQGHAAEFSIGRQELDGHLFVLDVHGELDVSTVGGLRDALNYAFERGSRRLVIDLTDVSFVDSISVAALVNTARRLGDDGRLAIVLPRESYAMLVFEAGGIASVLPLYEERDAAIGFARS